YRYGPAGFAKVKFTRTASQMQVASGMLGLSSFLFFLLFLRSVARCFNDTARQVHISTYLMLIGMLASATLWLFYANSQLLMQFTVLGGLASCWVISFMWYLCLSACLRTGRSRGRSRLRSPLVLEEAAGTAARSSSSRAALGF